MALNYPATPTPNDPDSTDTGWIPAPGASHVQEFRFVDRRNSREGKSSEIWVRFRAVGNKGVKTYYYSFSDHDDGEVWFNQLAGSEHPGEVVWEFRRRNFPVTGPL